MLKILRNVSLDGDANWNLLNTALYVLIELQLCSEAICFSKIYHIMSTALHINDGCSTEVLKVGWWCLGSIEHFTVI